jgi:hypothetical protein
MPDDETQPTRPTTIWTPAPPVRQMDVTIDIGQIDNTDLIAEKIKVGRYMWSINFNIGGPKALIQSLHDFQIPSDPTDPNYKSAVKELERAVAYMRAAVTFAFDTPSKRGFEGFIGEIDFFFPSANDANTTAYKRGANGIAIGTQVLKDIGAKYTQELHGLLEYWRRAFELGEMFYFSEAYLNYYKILEFMNNKIDRGTNTDYQTLRTRFNTDNFKRRNGVNYTDVKFAASVFAFLGYPKVTTPMFRMVCRFSKIRNHLNVGHTRKIRKGAFYAANGQFNNDFDLTAIEGDYLKEVSRLMILHYKGYHLYVLDGTAGPYVLKKL